MLKKCSELGVKMHRKYPLDVLDLVLIPELLRIKDSVRGVTLTDSRTPTDVKRQTEDECDSGWTWLTPPQPGDHD